MADEAVSALDVSVGAVPPVRLATPFLTHDLRVSATIRGRIVEMRPTADPFRAPGHDDTRSPPSAVPRPGPNLRRERSVGRWRLYRGRRDRQPG